MDQDKFNTLITFLESRKKNGLRRWIPCFLFESSRMFFAGFDSGIENCIEYLSVEFSENYVEYQRKKNASKK